MAANRPTMREVREQRAKRQRAEMEVEIAEGRLVVRQMTARERREADAHRAAGADARAARTRRNRR